MQGEGILRSKLKLPAAVEPLISRSHLFEWIRNNESIKLLIVRAPAGYGKTVCVSEWARANDQSTAYVALSDQDNCEKQFWRYIIAAVNDIQPGFADHVCASVKSNADIDSEHMASIFTDCLKPFTHPNWLIIENYHWIKNSNLHKAFVKLIKQLPEHLCIILTTRDDTDVVDESFKANGTAVTITANHLRLTIGEVSTIVGDFIGRKNLTRIYEMTGGWPAGVKMAGLIMTDHPNHLNRLTGEHLYFTDYFSDEVFSFESQEVQTFLVKTAVLERLSVPLCNAVTGNENADEMFEYLAKKELFLEKTGDERFPFRYRPLFRAFLQLQLRRIPGSKVTRWHFSASERFRASGFYKEAIYHLMKAKEFTDAASVISDYAPDLLKNGDWNTLENCVTLLKKVHPSDQPELLLILCWTRLLKGEISGIETLLDQTEQMIYKNSTGLQDRLMKKLFGELDILRSFASFMKTDVAGAIKSSAVSFPNLEEGPVLLQSELRLNHDEAQVIRGRLGLNGRLERAFQFYHHIDHHWETMPLTLTGYVCQAKAEILYEWNDFDLAFDYSRRSLDIAKHQENVPLLVPAVIHYTKMLMMSRLFNKQDANQIENALSFIEQASQIVMENAMSDGDLWRSLLAAQAARLYLSADEIVQAEKAVRKCRLSVSGEPDMSDEFENVTYLRLLVAKGDLNAALKLSERILLTAEREKRLATRIECFILRAMIYKRKNQSDEALKQLSQALTIAEQEGYQRLFLDEGPEISRMLTHLLNRSQFADSNYPNRLLKSLASENPMEAPFTSVTKREIHILQMISEGLTNRKIAEQIAVTEGTLKGYLVKLYHKLNVKKRTEAVTKARELGLIDKNDEK